MLHEGRRVKPQALPRKRGNLGFRVSGFGLRNPSPQTLNPKSWLRLLPLTKHAPEDGDVPEAPVEGDDVPEEMRAMGLGLGEGGGVVLRTLNPKP